MREKKKFTWQLSLLAVLLIFIISMCVFIGISIKDYNDWYDGLTKDEKIQLEEKRQIEYESRICKYEVTSVHIYEKPICTNMGAVIDTDICYAFTYIDGSTLRCVEDFQHLEYGLTKIVLGDKDLYIVNNNGQATRTLQLTKETLKNIKR